jgi:hypothetical protein
MIRPARLIAPFAVAALATAALAAPSGSVAASSKICKLSVSASEHLGPSYVLYAAGKGGYKVSGTSCATGKKVIKAFHSCRYKHGKSGKCTSKVSGYKCTEKRPAALSIPTEFTGNVTCKSGSKRVIHTYQQSTS